jgi:transcriptional regulator with XRE-family HTH domain
MGSVDGEIEAAFYGQLGLKLREKRKQRGLSRNDVALAIGTHRNTILRWEMGDMIPVWMLLRWCDVLSCQHFMMLPARELTWGRELPKITRERDPPISDAEAMKLRRA